MKVQPADVELRNMPKRPFGVYVVVVILLLGILVAILKIVEAQTGLTGFWAFLTDSLRNYSSLVSLLEQWFSQPTSVIIVNSAFILLWVMVIAGMWQLQRWAWLTLMIFAGLNLIYTLFHYFNDDPDYISMLINVAVVFYLNERSVQQTYARRKPGGEA